MQPNSKRRRLNAASSTLSKPFKSPLRKQQPVPQDNTASIQEGEGSGSQMRSVYNLTSTPVTPASVRTQDERRQSDAFQSHQTRESKRISINPSLQLSPTASQLRSVPESAVTTALLASLRKQESALRSQLVSLRRDLDTVTQAVKIEQTGQDTELEALVVKWRAASREAAEELFVSARDKVNRMGGVGVWKEKTKNAKMRQARGWEEEEETKKNDGSEDEDDEHVESEKEKRRREIEDEIAAGQAEDGGAGPAEESDGEDVETFTMDMMLRSLNIDLNMVGFDKVNQRWMG